MRCRSVLVLLAAAAITACELGGDRDCGALGGGCGPTGGGMREPVVAGFPSARAFAGVGRLTAGDTMTLYAIRVGGAENPCVGADTLRSDVRWGVSNPSAATITPLPNGAVIVRAEAQGNFQVLMREGGIDAPSASTDTKIVVTCPANVPISSIGVAP
ncbi:MAG TPA: hypothetical protein VJT85_06810 [Gemmatimonadaceae bacterium]|nr:hypothetical protein [Gemmatimonadaceae bacterium]